MSKLQLKQDEYLTALRQGDLSLIKVRKKLSDDSQNDFANFKNFLADNGQPDPRPKDLYTFVKRKALLRILSYAKDRNCLGLQYCFGFTKPVDRGGRFRYVNKGTIVDRPCEGGDTPQCEDEIYNSDFKVRDTDLEWHPEHFLNFQLKHPLPLQLAHDYIAYFKSIYKNITPDDEILTGSLLPVRAMLTILNDSHTLLGVAPILTFRWGLTAYEPNELDPSKTILGNFTLVIGIGDVSHGPVIERRTENKISRDPGDCPPRRPCGT